jgi:DNA-binding NarL/FixJ family response regulator
MARDPLTRVRAMALTAEMAEATYRQALDARDKAILAAIGQGVSMAAIGRTAGLSRNQVFNISRGTRISPSGPKDSKA